MEGSFMMILLLSIIKDTSKIIRNMGMGSGYIRMDALKKGHFRMICSFNILTILMVRSKSDNRFKISIQWQFEN